MVSNPTMQVVYSPDGMLHDPPTEVTRGEAKPYLGNGYNHDQDIVTDKTILESPARLASIKAFIDSQPNQFSVISPQDYSLTPIVQVHEQDYIEFLSTIHQDWVKDGMPPAGTTGESFVLSNVVGKLDPAVLKKNVNQTATGRIGYYTFDMSVAFMKGKRQALDGQKKKTYMMYRYLACCLCFGTDCHDSCSQASQRTIILHLCLVSSSWTSCYMQCCRR